MLSSLHHTRDDYDDDHLRTLIDQRFARADVHGCFPSAASDVSDTPSVYSRSYFSPRPSHTLDYDYPSPISPTDSRGHDHDQPTSMLDLDYDPRSSIATSAGCDHGTTYDDEEEDNDSSPTTRMSYLGPKMRVHSRAPWEMDNGLVEEDEEPEVETRRFPPGFPFSRGSSAKRGTSSSSSPRPSYASRPSAESARSQVPPKRSFETINSQISYPRGALYALAQESMSTHSLGRPSAPPQRESLRNKFSLGRLRSETSTALPPVPSPIRTPVNHRVPSPSGGGDLPTSPLETSNPNTPYASSNYPAQPEDAFHPYANPDLIVSYAEEQEPQPTSRTSNYLSMRNDSSVTVTESSSADSVSRSTIRSTSATLTPDSSINTVSSKHRTSSVNLKAISSPVSVVVGTPQRIDSPVSDMRQEQTMTVLPPGVSNIHGWTERHVVPAFSLISLEEARAQRMRSSTVNYASRMSSSSGNDASTACASGEDESSSTTPVAESSSPLGTLASRARGRSISAGSKAKNALQTIVGQPKMERRDSDPVVMLQQGPHAAPTGKTLKNKKSGFMRLFNAGKAQEKDSTESPPPVPSLPDQSNQNQPLQRMPKSTVTRIPVPSLSSSLLEAVNTQSYEPSSNDRADSLKPAMFSPKRVPPALSISTAPGSSARVPASAIPDRAHQGMSLGGLGVDKPWLNDLQPQSAPANVSEFPALKLRPVSTMFSAQFGDHIVSAESRSSDETTDLDTPRSPSPTGMISPVTPGFSRSSNEQPQVTIGSEDISAVRALQDQFSSARKAWQRQVRELEAQVLDLKAELETLKSRNTGNYCQSCGTSDTKEPISGPTGGSVLNRPRARTGASSRFGSALP